MKNLFNLDNPFIQFLSRVFDLMMLNALFIICSLPVVTLGASLSALQRVVQDMVYEQDDKIIRSFFRAFAQNFKQATAAWLILLVVIVSLVCDVLLVMGYFSGTLRSVMYVLIAGLAILVASVAAYLFPLLTRYDNTLRQHLYNALILAIIKLPRTLLLVLMELLPLILFLTSVPVFVQTLIFWVTVGFGFMTFLQTNVLKPVFAQLEKGSDKVTVGK